MEGTVPKVQRYVLNIRALGSLTDTVYGRLRPQYNIFRSILKLLKK